MLEIMKNNHITEDNSRSLINLSGIFSELIKAAGLGCEYYASDLFYNLTDIQDAVDNYEWKTLYIGIRTSGVDNTSFVRRRLDDNSCGYDPNCYLRLYRVEICPYTTDYGSEYMRVTLTRIDEYTAQKELVKED